MSYSCALTGHRELPEDFDKDRLYDALEEEILNGCDEFFCGMAFGFDLTALDCLVKLREKYPLRLVACVPYREQDSKYSPENKLLYARLLEACDEKVMVRENKCRGCFHIRDRYMVDRADKVFAYCTKDVGGTVYTVSYAKKRGIEVRRFA